MAEKCYLVIWAGYVHRAVFRTGEDAEAFIERERLKPGAWGVWSIEEVDFEPQEGETHE